jgi:curved DNA-binding protein CbpA
MPSQPDHARLAALTVLGLSDTATAEQITAAYRRLAKTTHPDLNGRTDPDAAVRFAEISAAYQRLVDGAEKPTTQSRAGRPPPRSPWHQRDPRFTAAGSTPRRRQQLVAGPVVITAPADIPQTGAPRTP